MSIYDKYGREKFAPFIQDFTFRYVATTTSSLMPGTGGKSIFGITGAIHVWAFVAHVTESIPATVTTMSATFIPDSIATSNAMSNATTITSTTAGSIVDLVAGFNPFVFTHVQTSMNSTRVQFVADGTFRFVSSATPVTGLVKFYLLYSPLSTASYVNPIF